MALYALGDLHLSFQANKPMDSFGKVWKNHEKKIEKYVNKIVKPEDTLVLTGDHSWGRKLPECREDLEFIQRLPGRKILLRGNHDMFWDAKKTERLNEEYKDQLFFLQNNFAVYQDYALVGTKGFTFEGPFYLNRRGEKWTDFGSLFAWLRKRDIKSLLCSFTIRPPIFWKKPLLLQKSLKNTKFQQWCIPTVTENPDLETVYRGISMA